MSIVGRRCNPSERTSRFADSSDDDEDDYEVEQERILSDVHGEAKEVSHKRELNEEDIQAEYTKTRPKKPRVVFKESDLTGMKGLIRIPTEFAKLRVPKKSNVDAVALYAKRLIQNYKSFCYDLFPGMAMEDVLARVETFGSRKPVREYLKHMREEARNKHMEAVLGKETADRLVQELQEGLAQPTGADSDVEEEPAIFVEPRNTRSVLAEVAPVLRPTASTTQLVAGLVDTDDEDEAEFNDDITNKKMKQVSLVMKARERAKDWRLKESNHQSGLKPVNAPQPSLVDGADIKRTNDNDQVEVYSEKEEELTRIEKPRDTRSVLAVVAPTASRKHSAECLVDTDDEGEAEFDDVHPRNRKTTRSLGYGHDSDDSEERTVKVDQNGDESPLSSSIGQSLVSQRSQEDAHVEMQTHDNAIESLCILGQRLSSDEDIKMPSEEAGVSQINIADSVSGNFHLFNATESESSQETPTQLVSSTQATASSQDVPRAFATS